MTLLKLDGKWYFNGNTNDKSRGIQFIGPGCLQKVIKGVNGLLFPIESALLTLYQIFFNFNTFMPSVFYHTSLDRSISSKRSVWLDLIISLSLRKHAYSNILKILPPNKENFQIKNLYIFHISAQNIDCGYWAEIRKTMYTPVNPSFTI